MSKLVSFCLLLVVGFNSFSQNDFFPDTTLLAERSIKLLDFASSDGVAVSADNEVFLIASDLQISDLTAAFADFSDSEFLAVAYFDPSLFFIGTKEDSLLLYRDGNVVRIGADKGLIAAEINSLRKDGAQLLLGTEKGLYVSDSSYNEFYPYHYGPSDRRTILQSKNPHSTMYMIEQDSYCGNISDHEFINLRMEGVYVTGLYTEEALKDQEKIRDVLLLYSGGQMIWNYSDFIFGSNFGLRWNSLCDKNIHTLLDSTSVNDLLLYKLHREFDFPDVIFVATDNGAYIIDRIYNINEMQVNSIGSLAGRKVHSLAMKDANCDHSVWMGTESGLVKYTSADQQVSYSRPIPEYYERDWCQGDYYSMGPIRSGNFNYQWIRNGEPVADATSAVFTVVEPGFYQLVYSNCHLHDTLDVATYHYYEELNTELNVGSDLEFCANQTMNISAPYGLDQTYQWYKDDEVIAGATYRYLEVRESGTYQYKTWNCNDVSAFSEHVEVVIHPAESPVLDPSYLKDSFCEGDTVKLIEPEANVSILWWDYRGRNYNSFDDKTYFVLSVAERPNYVKFTTEDGCEEQLYIPTFDVQEPPVMVLPEDTVLLCGNITEFYSVYTSYGNTYWSDGETGGRVFEEAGLYTVYAETYSGCRSSVDSVVVFRHPVPEFELISDTSLYFGDSLLIEGPEGYDEYYWNNRLASKDFFFKPAKTGLFHLQLTLFNEYGCQNTEYVTIMVSAREHSVLGTTKTTGPKISPNPVSDLLSIQGIHLTTTTPMKIFTLAGKEVTRFVKTTNNQLDVSVLDRGVYLLYADGHSFRFYKK